MRKAGGSDGEGRGRDGKYGGQGWGKLNSGMGKAGGRDGKDVS